MSPSGDAWGSSSLQSQSDLRLLLGLALGEVTLCPQRTSRVTCHLLSARPFPARFAVLGSSSALPFSPKACRGLLVCTSMEALPMGPGWSTLEMVTFLQRPRDDSAFTVVQALGPVPSSLNFTSLVSIWAAEWCLVSFLVPTSGSLQSSWLSEKLGLRSQIHRGKRTHPGKLCLSPSPLWGRE